MTARPGFLEVAADPYALYERSMAEGWGDGLPLLPPTEARVAALLAASPYPSDHIVAVLPPAMGAATAEKVAANAAMAGCTPDHLPVVFAVLEAASAAEFNLFGLTTTTSSVAPAIVVNGPNRARLHFDMGPGCMGGAAGRGSTTVGRAVQLCIRNIGGQKVGFNSKSVFGQPARSAGLCIAEWEEESPWAPLATRLGHPDGTEVVTVHGSKGTMPLADVHVDDGRELLRLVAKSFSYPLTNQYLTPSPKMGQVLLAINPVWAKRFAQAVGDAGQVQEFLFEHAWQPIELWPEANRAILERNGRVDDRGRVALVARPDQIVPFVCGGHGSLHTIVFPSWGESAMQSQVVRRRS